MNQKCGGNDDRKFGMFEHVHPPEFKANDQYSSPTAEPWRLENPKLPGSSPKRKRRFGAAPLLAAVLFANSFFICFGQFVEEFL